MTLTQTINSSKLENIIDIPEDLKNRTIEIIIRPVFNESKSKDVSDIIKSLTGIIPNTGNSLKAYQDERRSKIEKLGIS